MKILREIAFMLVGVIGLWGAISLLTFTGGWFLMFAFLHQFFYATLAGLAFFIEVLIINWFLYDYHGE